MGKGSVVSSGTEGPPSLGLAFFEKENMLNYSLLIFAEKDGKIFPGLSVLIFIPK